MRMKTSIGIVAVIVASALAACTPMRTFPPTDPGPTADSSVPPMPELMRLAIEAGHARSSASGEAIIFNLPPGVRKSTWNQIADRLPSGGHAMRPGDSDVVSVEAIRLSGGRAEVDVVVPQGEHYQLFTMHVTGGGLGGWRVNYAQPWSIRTDPPSCNNPWAIAAVSDSAADANVP